MTKSGRVPYHDMLTIPGVGQSIANDLLELGYLSVASLRSADPEEMFMRLQTIRNVRQDRCLLYVFRCAVYFAQTSSPETEKLKWWNWKD